MQHIVQRPSLRHSYCLTLALSLLISTSVFSKTAVAKKSDNTAISVSTHIGHDSNPFRFSNKLNAQSAQYIEAKLKGSYDLTDSFFVYTKLDARKYDNDSKDADSSKYTLGIGYKQRFKFSHGKMKLKSKLQYGSRDKTYISRTTGKIAQWSGEDIGDRYDYTFYGVNTDLSWTPHKKNIFSVNLDYLNRNYENLALSTLSNLDYSEYTLGLNWKHKFDKTQSLKAKIAHRFRDYEDYRAHDNNGIDIQNSDLEYNTWIARLTYSIKASDAIRFSFLAQFDKRDDNKSGYDNSEKQFARIGLKYDFNKYSELDASVNYTKYDYPNREQESNDQDEELSEEKGFRYKVQYTHSLANIKGLALTAALRYDDIKSDLSIYQYDRSQISVGAKYKF